MDQIVNWGGWLAVGTILKWAVWPAIVAAFVSWGTTKATIKAQSERLRQEFQLELATEAAIRTLLSDSAYTMRSFDKIKHHLPGFENDNELRRYLIRAGAIRFTMSDGSEGWGLLEKHKGQAFK